MLHSLQNVTLSDQIMDEVTKTMKSYPFDFRGARIITGMEEGAYGWITINYLLEGFVKVRLFVSENYNIYISNLTLMIGFWYLYESIIPIIFYQNSMHSMVNGFTLRLGIF